MKTPFCQVELVLSLDTVLDERTLKDVYQQGFSCVPVSADRDNKNLIVGILLAKSLIGVVPSDLTIWE